MRTCWISLILGGPLEPEAGGGREPLPGLLGGSSVPFPAHPRGLAPPLLPVPAGAPSIRAFAEAPFGDRKRRPESLAVRQQTHPLSPRRGQKLEARTPGNPVRGVCAGLSGLSREARQGGSRAGEGACVCAPVCPPATPGERGQHSGPTVPIRTAGRPRTTQSWPTRPRAEVRLSQGGCALPWQEGREARGPGSLRTGLPERVWSRSWSVWGGLLCRTRGDVVRCLKPAGEAVGPGLGSNPQR